MNYNQINEINEILTSRTLFGHDEIFSIAEKMCDALDNEDVSYRLTAQNSKPGSLLDFHNIDIPVVVIPDLHARPYFLNNILNYILPQNFIFGMKEISVFEALQKNLINLVFLGDALHTERTTKERWFKIEDEFDNEVFDGENMKAEMNEGLSLLMGLYYLKISFPKNFHFLKGNHENILNINSDIDYSFRKYADEGQMVKNFMQTYYGDDILYLISLVENNLPFVYFGKYCVISHAEPKFAFTKNQLINARFEKSVARYLIWTDNGEAKNNSAKETIENLFGDEEETSLFKENCIYLAGHRCIRGKYNALQNGKFIQIHNPLNQNIALVYNNRKFNPETDIKNVLE